MKKLFTFAAALLAAMAMNADVIFSYTLTTAGVDGTTYDAVGGTAKCLKAMASSGSNEITIGDQTFYKFNSSSAWEFTLADEGTFAEGDVVSITAACTTSDKKGKGVKLNGITLTGDFPANETNTLTYTVTEGDAIAGTTTIKVERADSDIKFGTISVSRENVTPSTDPVEAAVISGENACALGGSVELTCTAAKATTYQWYLNGAAIDGAIAKKYTFTPTAAGEFSFTCAASNDYTATPVVAAAHVVTVTDPSAACGELIKAVLNGGTSATMSGVLGGTFDTNLGSGKYKLDKGKYIGIQLAAGSFIAGDVVTITMTTAGQNYPCLFADKDRTNCLFLATEVSEALEYQITLPSAATGLTSLYLSRDDDDATYKWNPVVASISVTRSCEASDNADLEKVWIQVGEMYQEYEAAEDGLTYNLAVPASVDLAELDVYFTLAHPMANANVASPVHFTVPEAGQSVSETVEVTAQDGETVKIYTINVSKSAAASTDASLKSLAVTGYTLDPTFADDVYAYTITKAYGADDPTPQMVVCEPNDATAHPQVAAGENALVVTVTAEDGQTQLVYTINIAVAEAPKKINEVIMSNDYSAYILATEPNNIYAYYLAGQEAPTVKSYNVNEGTTWAQEGNTITLTGADQSTAEYTLIVEAVTPLEFTADEIIFDGSESWIKSGYGFDAEKKWKFSKTDSDYSREIAGKTHIEMFLPACDSIALLEANVSTRDIKVYINGAQLGDKVSLKKNEKLGLKVSQSAPFMLTIASAQTSGDGGVASIQLFKNATALENIEAAGKAVKVIVNGQLLIKKGNVLYNATGAIVK